jgi:hypothetical protein
MDQAMASRPQTDDFPVADSSAEHPVVVTGPPEDERRAVLARRAGDRDAFRLIVERYGDLLYGTAYLMLGDRARAEETVQDALVDAWRGLDQFAETRPLRPWLLRVLVNRVMQVRRRKLFGLIPFERRGLRFRPRTRRPTRRGWCSCATLPSYRSPRSPRCWRSRRAP